MEHVRSTRASALKGATILAAVLALGALTTPLVAEVTQTGKTYRIGWLSPASAEDGKPNLEALRRGLRELGYIEGKNLQFEVRWADSKTSRLPALAAELAQTNVDIICTAGSQASEAAKGATTKIPIVFANVAFPDKTGLVASYARPGGNVTGVAFVGAEYAKRLELLREMLPRLSRVALIYNPDNAGSALARHETEHAAKSLGIALEAHPFRGPEDFDRVFAGIAARTPDALMTTADPLIASHSVRIVDFANRHGLPSMYPGREFVDAGGLMFYGGSIPEMYRMAAGYVHRILRGASPRSLPVEQPIKFDMIINAKAARALGLNIPQTLRLRADEVIE